MLFCFCMSFDNNYLRKCMSEWIWRLITAWSFGIFDSSSIIRWVHGIFDLLHLLFVSIFGHNFLYLSLKGLDITNSLRISFLTMIFFVCSEQIRLFFFFLLQKHLYCDDGQKKEDVFTHLSTWISHKIIFVSMIY